MGFGTYVPAHVHNGTGAQTDNYMMFAQLWQFAPARPPVGLEIAPNTDNSRWQLVVRNDDTGKFVNQSAIDWPVRASGTLERDQWITWVLGFKLDPQGDSGGFVKLWKDGSLVADYAGKVGFVTDRQQVNAKLGMYRGGDYYPSYGSTEMYFDEIRFGTTYASVAVPVPEPSAMACGIGGGFMAMLIRRRR
jgi:hypothetical protein